MIGARACPECELCKRERRMDLTSTDALPIETVAHIQSAGCKAQKKSVISSTTISRNLGLLNRRETQSGKGSCTSCLMHKTRSCAHTLHKDRVRKVTVAAKRALWKKLSQGWTDLNKTWRKTVRRSIDVGTLEQEGRSRVWQPELSTERNWWQSTLRSVL
jgi:hypothetical protein